MIRVALAMLTHDKAKYIALVAGIAFASLLISQQAAIFWSALRSSTYGVQSASAADIWVMKSNVEILDLADPMKEGVVNQVRSVPGVQWAVPYYQALGMVRTRQGSFRPVLVIGVDDATLIGAPAARMVAGDVRALEQPNAVIFDVSGYQQNFPDLPVEIGQEVEIGHTRAVIAGFCKAPPAWGGQTVVYTTRSLAVQMSRETENTVSFVLAKAEEGADPDEVARRIEKETGLKARSSRGFSAEIIEWMLRFSGVAEFFGVTILMGVVIGVAIVGQTFYLFSVENVKQFATLKAIGVGNRSVLGMIFLQASLVAVIGFSLGVGVASLFFAYFGPGTGGLRGMNMPVAVFIGTGVFIYLMVVASCFLSIRRVLTADPAIVFRN
jgi:putative ABC transport system permease protein